MGHPAGRASRPGRRPRLAAVLLLALALTAGAAGQASIWPDGSGPHLGLDLSVGTPSAIKDVFRAAFPGASLRWVAAPRLELSLDYAFMAIEYYYPTVGGGWAGPVQWSSMPPEFSDMKASWIFYHTRHFLAPQAWYLAPLDSLGLPLALRIGGGPALSFLVPNESATYYPGLAEAFEQFRSGFTAYLGLSFRLGLEYRAWNFFRLGAEYLFIVDSLADVATNLGQDPGRWFARAGNLVLWAGIRL